jgi:hypothetical protein
MAWIYTINIVRGENAENNLTNTGVWTAVGLGQLNNELQARDDIDAGRDKNLLIYYLHFLLYNSNTSKPRMTSCQRQLF